MVINAGIINLRNINTSSNVKKEIDKALLLSFIGLVILIIGIFGVLKMQEAYWTYWLTTSGFITTVYSLIKVIMSMVN